jgi:hypothetical protein
MWTQRILKLSTRSTTAPSMYMLAYVEREVVVLAPHCQVSDLLPIACLIIIVSSAKLMMVLESCAATQSWLNREYRRV